MAEIYDIMAELVINSANDVLKGYQTFDEHIKYLREAAAQYASEGIKLPFDLDLKEEERINNNDYRPNFTSARQKQAPPEPEPEEKVSGPVQGLLFGADGYGSNPGADGQRSRNYC